MLGERSGLRGRGLLVVMACFFCHMGLGWTYVFGGLQPAVTEELEIGRGAFAAAAQTRNYVIALASPALGFLLVRVGAGPVFAAGLAILCGAAFALSAIESYAGLLSATLILGLGITCVGDITVGHAVSRWITRSRGAAFGMVYTASNLGGRSVVLAVAALAAGESWREGLQSAGLATLFLLLPFAALIRSPRPDEVEAPEIMHSEVASSDMDLHQAARTRSFWILVFVHLTYFAFAIAVVEHFVTYLIDEGTPPSVAAERWGLAIATGVASKLVFGFVSDRIPARWGMFILIGMLTLSSGLLILAPNPTFVWLFVFVFGFSYAARDVVTPLIVIDCFGVQYMAKVYGAIYPTLLVGGGAGAVLTGLCADWLGTYRPAFVIFAVLNLAAICLVPLLRHEGDAVAPS